MVVEKRICFFIVFLRSYRDIYKMCTNDAIFDGLTGPIPVPDSFFLETQIYVNKFYLAVFC